MMNTRMLIINKCHDCPDQDCQLRKPAGLIPDACPGMEKDKVFVSALKSAIEIESLAATIKTLKPIKYCQGGVAAEPRPLLADAAVGDLCKRRDGKLVQIDSLSNDRPCPIMCKSDIGGMDCFTLDGRNHNAVGDEKDIVHCEPLAAEGTAEWAWQMLMLNIKVWHPAEQSMETTALPKDRFIACHAKTGWTLYEPQQPREPEYVTCKRCGGTGYEMKPEPAKEQFKVGDCKIEFVKQELKNLLDKI